jgi:hypothetical protein
MKKWTKEEKPEFAINPYENAADKGREARPRSLAENSGDASSKISGSLLKVGQGRGYGTSVLKKARIQGMNETWRKRRNTFAK